MAIRDEEMSAVIEESAESEDQPKSDIIVEKKKKKKKKRQYFSQYTTEDGNKYFPIGDTEPYIPPGLYMARVNNRGVFAELVDYASNDLIRFPDSESDKIQKEFDSFWEMKDKYIAKGEQHKRGYLLWGPPGGGKTCLVTALIQQFIEQQNGVVFLYSGPTKVFMEPFRDVEPDRKVMIVIEDIDVWFEYQDEAEVLALLDGETPLVYTVVIATTNYPEKLPDRIKNRPSRFDRVTYIGNPNYEQRLIYIQEKATGLNKTQQKKWAKDTKGYSFAHIKELIFAVEFYGASFENTLERLNKMRQAKSDSKDYEEEMRGENTTKVVGFHQTEPKT